MSSDTMPCGCLGHADNADLCRYPALEQELAAERKRREEAEADNAALLKRLLDGCCLCHGKGVYTTGCSFCGDSTYDHECNDGEVTCKGPVHAFAKEPHPGAALLEYVRALEGVRDACAAYFEHCAGSHDDGCPEDDTCECPHIVRVNEAFSAVSERKP